MLAAPPPKIKLTDPQEKALLVLFAHGGKVPASKRSSRHQPVATVNIRAVGTLVMRGLAKCHRNEHYWSPYTHDDKYEITEAGRSQAVFHYGQEAD